MTVWKPVVGYEGFYEVSDDGQVRSIDRVVPHASGSARRRGKVLSPAASSSGHLRVALSRNGELRGFFVHRLVLTAFVGPCPEGRECCHKNGVSDDNRVENLYWGTRVDNCQDSIRHGTYTPPVNRYVGTTACSQGHEYVPGSYTMRSANGRRCVICSRKKNAEYKRRKRIAGLMDKGALGVSGLRELEAGE